MAPNIRKIRDRGSNFSHKTASFMLASFTTISKIHISYALPYSHEKREMDFLGCSTNPVGEKSPTGFFICKKEKSRL